MCETLQLQWWWTADAPEDTGDVVAVVNDEFHLAPLFTMPKRIFCFALLPSRKKKKC